MRTTHGMKLPYPTDKLRLVLEENRDKHEAAYNAALTSYRELCRTELRTRLGEIEAEDKWTQDPKAKLLEFDLEPPVSYAHTYNTIIRMLELTSDATVELEAHQFEAWVMDSWDWSRDFMTKTIAPYS